MNENFIIVKLTRRIEEYAIGKANDVKRGAETSELAALLLQKYGYGIIDAVSVIYENSNVDYRQLFKILDIEVEKINPNWQENQKKRWAGNPAGIIIN